MLFMALGAVSKTIKANFNLAIQVMRLVSFKYKLKFNEMIGLINILINQFITAKQILKDAIAPKNVLDWGSDDANEMMLVKSRPNSHIEF